MNKPRLVLLTFALGFLHLLLTVVVGFLVGMCEIGANWGDGGGAHSSDWVTGFLSVSFRVLQPILALFAWMTGLAKPLPLHRGATLLPVDLFIVVVTSFLFGLLIALFFSYKRKPQQNV